MTSVLQLAEMAYAAYDDAPRLRRLGWETERLFPIGDFFAALFSHRRTGQYVLAIRGTLPTNLTHLGNDAALLTRLLWPTMAAPAQQALLCSLAATGGREFYVTGHSLGGALAIILAALRRLPLVTFNALGPVLPSAWVWDRSDPTRRLHVYSTQDPATRTSARKRGRSAVLEVDRYRPTLGLGPGAATLTLPGWVVGPAVGLKVLKEVLNYYLFDRKSQHSMFNLLTAVRRHPELHSELGWLTPNLEEHP